MASARNYYKHHFPLSLGLLCGGILLHGQIKKINTIVLSSLFGTLFFKNYLQHIPLIQCGAHYFYLSNSKCQLALIVMYVQSNDNHAVCFMSLKNRHKIEGWCGESGNHSYVLSSRSVLIPSSRKDIKRVIQLEAPRMYPAPKKALSIVYVILNATKGEKY